MLVFKEYVDDIRIKLQQVAEVASEKDIQYGHQLVFVRGEEKVTVSVYYNKKNQFRLVWPNSKNPLCLELMEHLGFGGQPVQEQRARSEDQGLRSEGQGLKDFKNCWAGSDESGKGDFFGPLVVAAVAVNNETANALTLAGVRDCKELTDAKVLELEAVIKEKALAYSVLELLPEQYNLRYAQLKNLNTLNASGHFHALKNVLTAVPQAEGALIDQFLKDDIILKELRKVFPGKRFMQRPRAEENIAVGAASVLARAQFIRSMEKLAEEAGVGTLPKGSGPVQAAVAREIAAKFGKESLMKFVKTHFVTYKEV